MAGLCFIGIFSFRNIIFYFVAENLLNLPSYINGDFKKITQSQLNNLIKSVKSAKIPSNL